MREVVNDIQQSIGDYLSGDPMDRMFPGQVTGVQRQQVRGLPDDVVQAVLEEGDTDAVTKLVNDLRVKPKVIGDDTLYDWWSSADTPFEEKHTLIWAGVQAASPELGVQEQLEVAHFNATVYVSIMLRQMRDEGWFPKVQMQAIEKTITQHGFASSRLVLEYCLLHPEWVDGETFFGISLAMMLHDVGTSFTVAMKSESINRERELRDGFGILRQWEQQYSIQFPELVMSYALHQDKKYQSSIIKKEVHEGRYGEIINKKISKRDIFEIMRIADAITTFTSPTGKESKSLYDAFGVIAAEAKQGIYDLDTVNEMMLMLPLIRKSWHPQVVEDASWMVGEDSALTVDMWHPNADKVEYARVTKPVTEASDASLWDSYDRVFARATKVVATLYTENITQNRLLSSALREGDLLAQITFNLCLADRSIFEDHEIRTVAAFEDFLYGALMSRLGKALPVVVSKADVQDVDQELLHRLQQRQDAIRTVALLVQVEPISPVALQFIQGQYEQADGLGGPMGKNIFAGSPEQLAHGVHMIWEYCTASDVGCGDRQNIFDDMHIGNHISTNLARRLSNLFVHVVESTSIQSLPVPYEVSIHV